MIDEHGIVPSETNVHARGAVTFVAGWQRTITADCRSPQAEDLGSPHDHLGSKPLLTRACNDEGRFMTARVTFPVLF